MLGNVVVAALAFTAPPSLTRRDMLVGFGAAGAAMIPVVPAAFADPSKYAGSADRKKAEKAAAEKAKLGNEPTAYQQIMLASQERESKEKADIVAAQQKGGSYSVNGKGDDGVSYRKPSDPNGCSKVRRWSRPLTLPLLREMSCSVAVSSGVQRAPPREIWLLDPRHRLWHCKRDSSFLLSCRKE